MSPDRDGLLRRIDLVTSGVPYTFDPVCHLLLDLALTYERPQLLEIACGYGKSTAYLAAAAQATGGFLRAVDFREPDWEGRTAQDLVDALGVADACEITFRCDARWYLLDLLREAPETRFDLCYLDAAHSVEVDAFVALAMWTQLVPGGTLIFDDMNFIPEVHDPETVYSRPAVSHVRAVFDYVAGLPGAGDACEWGREQVGWSWGFIQKAGSSRPPLRSFLPAAAPEPTGA